MPIESVKEMACKVVALLQQRGLTLAVAESCTGGSIAAAVTSVPGCSSVMLGGVVAYNNRVKADVLGVSNEDLITYGAVSEPVVRQMVIGVSALLGADCAIATSGIAGPGGGSTDKPVGTVWVALKMNDCVETRLLRLADKGREENVANCVHEVLELLHCMLCR